jgi:hypothetical protein
MGKLSRTKGHSWERTVANRLTEISGRECKRCLIETREGNSGDVHGDIPLAVQCKVGIRPNPIAALEEAMEVAGVHEMPVAIIRRNQGNGQKKRDVAVIPLDDFYYLLDLYLKAHGIVDTGLP